MGRTSMDAYETQSRYRQRWADGVYRGLSAEGFDRAIEVLLIGLLAFGPLALGAVEAWSEQGVIALSAAMVLLLLAKRVLFPAIPFVWTWAYVPVAVFILLAAFQLVPLPASVVEAISPETVALKTELLGDLPAADEVLSSMSLSFYSRATRHDLRLVLAVVAVFVVVVNLYREPGRIKRLLGAIAVIGGALALLALAQDIAGNGKIYGFIPTYDGATSGPFINHSHYGQFMNLSMGAALALLLVLLHEAFAGQRFTPREVVAYLQSPEAKSIKLLIAMIVVGAATVFVSLTRGGMVSMLIAAVFTTLLLSARQSLKGRGWVIVLVALGVFVCVLWVGFDQVYDRLASLRDIDLAEGGRWQIVRDIGSILAKFPAFGTGLGTHAVVFPAFDTSSIAALAAHAENEYAQAAEETGLIGFVALIVFMILIGFSYALSVRGRSVPIRSAVYGLGFGLAAVAVHSFSDFGQHLPANAALTATLCGLLLALSARSPQAGPAPHRLARQAVSLALLVLAVGGFAWALLGANRARVAEAHWNEVRRTADQLENETWQDSEQAYAYLFEQAAAAVAAEPDNIEYAHQLGIYKWLSLTPYVDPNTDDLDPQALPWARAIVTELHEARPLCPTFGALYCLAGEIEKFALNDPNGAEHIRQGYRLAPNSATACFAAARIDVEAGDGEAAFAKLARAAQLDGSTFTQGAALCVDIMARPDLALQLAGENAGRLSYVADRLAAQDGHTDLAAQARARALELLAQQAEDPDAPAGTQVSMARHDVEQGEFDTAIARYRLALRKDYDQVGWHYELAVLLARTGRVGKARHEAQICLRLRPDYRPAQRLLEELAVRPDEGPLAAGQ
jgi:O-antigen ligase/tetratricopeptide (TPR) repeat protein